MKVVLVTVLTIVLGLRSSGHFDPQIRILGNLILALGNHLFARFTDTEVPRGYENGTFIEQVSYIHTMLNRMKDLFLNPPKNLKSQFRDLTQTFIFQVQSQLPSLDIEDKVLKEKFDLCDEDIKRFHNLANESKTFVAQIIETRGEEIPDKYV